MFAEFDADGSGAISSDELQAFAASLGMYWEAEDVERVCQEMDTDSSGDVNIKEFATWFVKNDVDSSESRELQFKLKAKLMLRQVNGLLKTVADSGAGRECKNKAAVNIGELDTATCPGMMKFYACASSPEDFAALNPSADAKIAFVIDFTLRPTATDEQIAAVVAGCDAAFEEFVVPMLESLPPPPNVPGMKEGKPYDSHSVGKVNVDGEDVLRFIAFSGLDPESIFDDFQIHEFVPSLHVAAYQAYAIADLLSCEHPAKVKDFMTGRAEVNFTWNTKVLAAIKAVAKYKPLYESIYGDGNAYQTPRGIAAAVARVFRAQTTSVEMSFNGYQQFAEAAVLDFGIPLMERERGRELTGWGSSGDATEAEIYAPFKKPSEEQIKAIITAVGEIGGKTFGNLHQEVMSLGPILPEELVNPNYDYGADTTRFMTPLFIVKEMLDAVPEEAAAYKAAGLAFVSAVSGVRSARSTSAIVKMGMEARGLDLISLLPTETEIMASECATVPSDDPEGSMKHIAANGNFWVKAAGQTLNEAVAAGVLNVGEDIPEEEWGKVGPIVEPLSYTPEELAAKQEAFSELLDVAKLVIPLMAPEGQAFAEQIIETEGIPGGTEKLNFAKATFTKFTTIEL